MLLRNNRVQKPLPGHRLTRGTGLLVALPNRDSREALATKVANPISHTAMRLEMIFQIVFSGKVGIAAVDGTFKSGRVCTSGSAGLESVDRRHLFLRLLAEDLEDIGAVEETTVVLHPGGAHHVWVLLDIEVFGAA